MTCSRDHPQPIDASSSLTSLIGHRLEGSGDQWDLSGPAQAWSAVLRRFAQTNRSRECPEARRPRAPRAVSRVADQRFATEPTWSTWRDFDKIGIGDSCLPRSDINEPRTTRGRTEGDADHSEGQGGAARHAQEAR